MGGEEDEPEEREPTMNMFTLTAISALAVALAVGCAWLARRWMEAKLRAVRAGEREAALTDTLRERESRIGELEAKLQTTEEKEHRQAAAIAQLETRLQDQAARFKEQGEFEQRMKDAVKILSQDAFQRHSDRLRETNREEMGHLLNPLKKDIRDFKDSFDTLKTETVRERQNLLTQFNAMNEAALKISKEANDLTHALKGEKQKQGAWGESVLETILQNSGLREGHEYSRQQSVTGDDGGRLRPDVIVRMPASQERVIIDSKVSLTDFIEYVNADDEHAREQALQHHLRAVRRHIAELGGKRYPAAADSKLDFVIMFMPIEASFAVIMEKDMAITEYAINNRVILATPTTLLLALRTIANLWHVERRNVNAEEIARRGGELYNKVALFLESFARIGERLGSARDAYDQAANRLKDGKGSIVRQTEMLQELGVNPSKSIPREWSGDSPEHEETPAPQPARQLRK